MPWEIPRPRGRGPIEETYLRMINPSVGQFRDRAVAAPLKQSGKGLVADLCGRGPNGGLGAHLAWRLASVVPYGVTSLS